MVTRENPPSCRPLVLILAGLDPSGAGLQADIETCFALGCHALPVATGLTVQSTRRLQRIIPTSGADLRAQCEILIEDVGPIAACKIGMLPSREAARALELVLAMLPAKAQVVLDPVMDASVGGALMDPELRGGPLRDLLARVDLIKPNLHEACRLTRTHSRDEAGARLSGGEWGLRYALITGADTPIAGEVQHVLYRDGELLETYSFSHVPGQFHGTGCTLSSAIAAGCAQGLDMAKAVDAALRFTRESISRAYSIGGQQAIPDRRCGMPAE